MSDDLHLLRQYAQEGSQVAFSTLVGRYVNLVYTAARRQVRSPQLAEEVAQSVFLDLSRQAGKLAPDTHLANWLFTVTRRTSIDFIRRESRRQAREHTASEIAIMNQSSPSAWALAEPLLDEAMDTLDDTDRQAVLLRYFEHQSLREVGAALGTSEDAAQKRVSRAVEQLREFFTKRGVIVSAASLAADLTAHGAEAAPAGLALSITTATFAAGTVAILSSTAASTLTMTLLQKSLLVLSILAVAGTGLYEARAVSLQSSQIQQFQQDSQHLADENRQLRLQRDDAQKQLDQSAKLADAKTGNPATTNALGDWVASVKILKDWLAKMPDKAIPEFQFLTEEDWLEAVKGSDLSTEDGARQALSKLRNLAKDKFTPLLQAALNKYLTDHDNQLPTALTDLKPDFDVEISDTMLDRYTMNYAGNANSIPDGKYAIQEKPGARVDLSYDSQLSISPMGTTLNQTNAVFMDGSANMNHIADVALQATRAYFKDHPNLSPKTTDLEPADLLPYVQDPADIAALKKLQDQVNQGQ